MSFQEDLYKVLQWFPYKGLLIQKTKKGYKWGSKKYKTIEELDVAIEEARKSLSYSIKK